MKLNEMHMKMTMDRALFALIPKVLAGGGAEFALGFIIMDSWNL